MNDRRKDSMRQHQATDLLHEWRESAQYWSKHSATIRTMFTPLTRALIQEAGIVPGQSVLDVAGGPGEPSLTIAETVGPTGSVTCTDAITEMVEAAEREAVRRGLRNVRFQQCTADSLPFPDNSFDATVSRLGAMFFTEPVAALREMLRVTKPGGSLALAVWHKNELNPFCYLVTEVMSSHVESLPVDPDAPGAFRFAEIGKLGRVMAKAGATEVQEHVFEFAIKAPISAREFWLMRSQTSDTLRGKLTKLSVDEQAQIADEVVEAVREYFPQDQMSFPAQMIIASGKKPRP
jgi:SAM-dependent methyltransferase